MVYTRLFQRLSCDYNIAVIRFVRKIVLSSYIRRVVWRRIIISLAIIPGESFGLIRLQRLISFETGFEISRAQVRGNDEWTNAVKGVGGGLKSNIRHGRYVMSRKNNLYARLRQHRCVKRTRNNEYNIQRRNFEQLMGLEKGFSILYALYGHRRAVKVTK